MNKTLTVNIAGLVFHIEENAYQKLYQYLEAIKRSITTEEREEIIHDIELRIAELFSSKIDDFNQVIIDENVEEVIQIMGKPEDYNLDGESDNTSHDETYYNFPRVKKLYRDKENSLLGGVLAGLGHYFKIDVVWMRVIFLILLLFYGTGVVLYIILWIVIPAAKTTTQILEMRGEPINISSIEKKVKENIEYVTNKVQNFDYQKISKSTKETTNQGLEIIKRIIGVLLLFVSIAGFLVASFATIFILKNGSYINNEFSTLFFTGSYPNWITTSLFLFVMLAPFIVFLLIGLKLLYSNIKYIGAFSITIVILWIISLFTLALPVAEVNKINQIIEVYDEDDVQYENEISLGSATDTLNIKMMDYLFFSDNENNTNSESIKNIPEYLDLDIQFLQSFQDTAYATLKVEVDGKEISSKKKRKGIVEIPSYNVKYKDNTLYISDSILYENNETSWENNIKLNFYLPEKSFVQFDEQLIPFIKNQNTIQKGNHTYQLINQQLNCVDCI
ncbi:PspC domain-containing protein [Myroides guanonis]|uniref:Phage shock protein C (PspC) family protein n=1 Tax=Myroides guanonis TaxID=1150112 RepID=A0A1I3P7R1_9FLAO|nr:PspC domain-containing protein [Myroides guanonis]SFJ17553.1 phage shock protein C (PspC) family protein [Myroides guanonis]